MDIVVLCVNYKNHEETAGFVRDVHQLHVDGTVYVVVSDNSPTGQLGKLSQELRSSERTSIIPAPDNPGYFRGAWRAFQCFLTEHPFPEWVIVSNTDISFPDPDIFAKLLKMRSNAAAVIAPDISTPAGVKLNPYALHRPTRWRVFLRKASASSIFSWHAAQWLHWVKRRTKALLLRCALAVEAPTRIFAPHGAFVIFHRSFFTAGGNLDPKTQLYGEEEYIGEVARLLSLDVIYQPQLRLIHRGRSVTGKLSEDKRRQLERLARQRIMEILAPSFAAQFRKRRGGSNGLAGVGADVSKPGFS